VGRKAPRLSLGEQLTAMFGTAAKDVAMALRMGVDERTVRRYRASGVACVTALQDELLRRMRGPHMSLDAFAQRLSWDETKYTLSIAPPVGSGLSSQQCMGPWSVLVQKRRFVALPSGGTPSYMSLVVPPAFLSSTGAAFVYTGLFTHTQGIKGMESIWSELHARANFTDAG
jgi:hypothetical protein